VKAAWERVRFDANALTATESGVRLASEQQWVTLNVKATVEAVTQDLRTEDAVLHGLRVPAPVPSPGRDLSPVKSRAPATAAPTTSLDRSARRGGGGVTKKQDASAAGLGRRQTSVGSIAAGTTTTGTGDGDDPQLADLVDAAQLLSVLRFAPVKFSA
jgi:hypothetical protein